MKRKSYTPLLKRVLASLRRLQWKLTLYYTLTIIMTLVIFEVIGILFIAQSITNHYPSLVTNNLTQEAQQVADYFNKDQLDQQALSTFLQNNDGGQQSAYIDQGSGVSVYLNVVSGFTVAVDKQGIVLGTTNSDAIAQSARVRTRLSPNGGSILAAALVGKTNAAYITPLEPDQTMVAAAPIFGKGHKIVAALLTKQAIPSLWKVLSAIVPLIWPSLLIVTSLAVVVGTIFGFLMSHWLTRRLKKVDRAAEKWSRGEFSSFVEDRSADEVGQLARQLNSMAKQFEELLTARQSLAILDERNRLARDLHDSVKQQIFAVSMQIGGAQALIDYNVEATRTRLFDIEQLIYRAQEELAMLIYQLRPSMLIDKNLAEALLTYCEAWRLHHNVELDMHIEENIVLPVKVEEAFFRVAQEALANVARHSQGDHVQLHLYSRADEVVLNIEDNGQGFDTQITGGHTIGLRSMQERMENIDGSLTISSARGQGTRISATCKKRS